MKKYRVEMETFTENGSVAITSILKGRNDKLYIGFTSKDHPVIEYDTKTSKYRDIGLMFNQPANNIILEDKVHNSLVMDENGILYIGQGLNINWEAAPYAFNLHKYGGGHMFSYNPQTDIIVDYGVIVPLNSIHGMTYDMKNHRIFGYSLPDNHFFRFDVDSGRTTDYGKISPYASHNYIAAPNGNVYGAWLKSGPYDASEGLKAKKGTYLLKYDSEADELIRTQNMIVFGLEYDIFCNIGIDSWICTSKGEIYGGTAIGGSLIKVNTTDDSIEFVGKPVLGPRLTSMTEASDGLIYGCAGFPHMSLFSFNPSTREIIDFGIMSDKGDFWYLHCITMGDDGIIYGGETDAGKACLVKLIPE